MFSLPSEELNVDLLVIVFIFVFFFTVTMIMLFSYEKLQCRHYEMARVSSEHLGYSTASLCQANWSILHCDPFQTQVHQTSCQLDLRLCKTYYICLALFDMRDACIKIKTILTLVKINSLHCRHNFLRVH